MTVTTNGAERNGGGLRHLARGRLGLSGKLLLLTIVFVMLAEVLVFAPSVANFRYSWLMDRLEAAQIAALAADVAPDKQLPPSIRNELLVSAKVHAVAVKRDETRRLILQSDMPSSIADHYDLRTAAWPQLVFDALAVYFAPPNRYIRVIGKPAMGSGEFIEVVIDEAPLRAAMVRFGLNILGLSIVISVITGALVYFALNALLVRPITALTHDMVRFSKDPENRQLIISPSERSDEIGTAQRELAGMQRQIADMLHQKSRLAALGLAVSKINHDLKNILATVQLISDRLGAVKDPTVQRFAPKLIASIDRAIRLCADTLKYGRTEEAPPERALFPLRPLAEEVVEGLGLTGEGPIACRLDIDAGVTVDADRDHLYRVLGNIVRNAKEALDGWAAAGRPAEIRLAGWREGAVTVIEISDTGPGVPDKAREHLFEPFHGAARRGGTGLGLAIAAELVRAHGGAITLLADSYDGTGAQFRLTVPDRVLDLKARRSA